MALGAGSNSPIEQARRLLAAFEKRDVEGMIEVSDPAAEFWLVTAEVTRDGKPYLGHDGIRSYMRDVEDVWEELQLNPSDFRNGDDVVVASGRVYARRAGYVQDIPAAWVMRFADGLIREVRVFPSLSRALGDAGMDT